MGDNYELIYSYKALGMSSEYTYTPPYEHLLYTLLFATRYCILLIRLNKQKIT